MSANELDLNFKRFSEKNFEKPSKCKNLEQIRYYVKELSDLISDFRRKFDYVPGNAYSLLAQYNQLQNQMLFQEYKNSYYK